LNDVFSIECDDIAILDVGFLQRMTLLGKTVSTPIVYMHVIFAGLGRVKKNTIRVPKDNGSRLDGLFLRIHSVGAERGEEEWSQAVAPADASRRRRVRRGR
jgi:hypothetical protein